MRAGRNRTKRKRGKTKSRWERWSGWGQVMQEREFHCDVFPKERRPCKFAETAYSITSRNPQLVPRESSPQMCCVLLSPHLRELPFLCSLSQLSPPLFVTFSRQHNKVLVIRCWLSQDTDHRDRQQAESEIISHLRLILFKEKESSKALLCADTKACTLKHTHIQNSAQKIMEKAA